MKSESYPAASGVDPHLARHGGITYLEIPAVDPQKSAAFYEALLHWRIMNRDSSQIKFSDPSGYLIGRFITGRPISRDAGMLHYIYVNDVEEVVRLAPQYGGEVAEAPRPEGNLRVARLRDPAGNLIGIWQAMPPA